MSFRRPGNPAQLKQAKFRQFDGIGGPRIQLIRRFNEKGWDISNTVCNEIEDFTLLQNGSMILRDGFRKTAVTGETSSITDLFYVTLGKVIAYAKVVNGVLSVITLPQINVRNNPITLSPTNAASAVASVYPNPDPSITYP